MPAELANRYKALPNINIACHAGKLLALSEGDSPYCSPTTSPPSDR